MWKVSSVRLKFQLTKYGKTRSSDRIKWWRPKLSRSPRLSWSRPLRFSSVFISQSLGALALDSLMTLSQGPFRQWRPQLFAYRFISFTITSRGDSESGDDAGARSVIMMEIDQPRGKISYNYYPDDPLIKLVVEPPANAVTNSEWVSTICLKGKARDVKIKRKKSSNQEHWKLKPFFQE